MNALVTDGDQRAALAVTRSLGRRGISVLVGEERPASLASASRYSARHVVYPSPYTAPEAFERFLLEFIERQRIDVVVPVTDVTTRWAARHQDAIRRRSAVAVPPLEAFELIVDKGSLVERAAACGIPVPRARLVEGIGGLKAILPAIEYPAVVKPVHSRVHMAAGWRSTTVRYAESESELLRLYLDTDYLACHPSLIQERICGPGLGVFVLCDRGRVRAAFAHRRLREKPPSGGASVLCESVALDPELVDQARRLLEPLAWHGVAMLEYKQDRRTGRSFLMEVNGRFWGSLQLAVHAGVDFPYLACQLALGQRLDAPRDYSVGVKCRWLLGDLDHVLLRLAHRRSRLHVPDGAPSRVRALLDFLRCAGSDLRYDVADRDDPHPFLREAGQYARRLVASAVALRGPGRRTARRTQKVPAPLQRSLDA